MEREVWHIFYLKVTNLIAITTFLIATSFLAITFGNHYAIYEVQYSVRLELHEIHRQYWSQFIYVCYLGTLLTCDLITCLAILYNLNYIILFDIFHHMTLLLVKVYSGFELSIPGEHSEGVLILLILIHVIIIISLSLLYRKLDSVIGLKELLNSEMNSGELEKRRLKYREQLNKRLLEEYEEKFVDKEERKSNGSSRRESNRNVELEPIDIEQDFDIIKKNSKNKQISEFNPNGQSYKNGNQYDFKSQVDYDSDGYLKVINNNRNLYSEPNNARMNKNQLTNSEDLILDQLNKQNNVVKSYAKSYSLDDESDDIYLEPDDAYIDNNYDYLKCNIDDHMYAQIQPKNSTSEPYNDTRIAQFVKLPRLPMSDNLATIKIGQISLKKSADKSVQTNQSSNSSNDTMYSTKDTLDSTNFQANASALKESRKQYRNNTKSRKIEYSTLKYDHKVYYESSV